MSKLSTSRDLIEIISNYSKPKVYYGYSGSIIQHPNDSVFVFESFEKALNKLIAVGRGEVLFITHRNPTEREFKTNYNSGWLTITSLLKMRTIMSKWRNTVQINKDYYDQTIDKLKEKYGNGLAIIKGCVWD